MIQRSFLLVSVFFLNSICFAEGGGEAAHHQGAVHIPWQTIVPQMVNFTIAVGLLILFVRKPITKHFKSRHELFLNQLNEANAAREKAEAQNLEWKNKLIHLESTSDASLAKANEEAEEMKVKIINDAKDLASRLVLEAERSGEFEFERVRNTLKEELLNNAIKMAKSHLKEGIKSPEQDRLQSEFVEKIQVVL